MLRFIKGFFKPKAPTDAAPAPVAPYKIEAPVTEPVKVEAVAPVKPAPKAKRTPAAKKPAATKAPAKPRAKKTPAK